jgi:crotonobetainyl-CoA:carnitine CoA-transferase CaiB-like acyl-CoA transferase
MLDDLRIVEIGEGQAVQVAGLLLAALGADVLKIERPEGDPGRGSARFANWNRNKRSLALDLDRADDLAVLRARLTDADALIHQFTPRRAHALALDDASLAAHCPRLAVCAVTGSPANHPDVERSDDELLVAARFGALYENDGHRAGPIVWRFNAGSWAAAHLAAAGVLARLIARQQSGRGGPAHTSLFQGHMTMLSLVWARNSKGPMPNNQPHPTGPRAVGIQLYECQDGAWLQIMDPTRQFDYASMPTMWGVLGEGVRIDTEEGKAEAFKRRPLDLWLADLRAADIAAEPAYPLGEVLRHPEARANGYVVDIEDPDLGPTAQPNAPFHADVALPPPRPAPRLGQDGARDWLARPDQPEAGGPAPEILSGVKVLDFGMFLAGPMAPSMMGDMGADVIKVEPLTGDRIRFMHRYYQAAARSKRSIALDLTKPQARPIFERLVGWADAVHHNLRIKAAKKLGLSQADIQAVNPAAVFNYVSAYGQRGERADWPGYDSIFNAIAGWEFENAGQGNKPVFNRPGTMDVTTAQSALVAMLASVYARRAGRPASATQTSLLGIATLTQGETLLRSDGTLAETQRLDREQTGFSPYHRIYQCRDGVWIAIAAHTAAHQGAVRAVLGDQEAAFAAAAGSQSSHEILAALEAAGAPCERVVSEAAEQRFFENPLNRSLNLISVLEQPLYGQVEQLGAFWTFADTPVTFKRCCPDVGQHTDEIMTELGFTEAEIADFRAARVIA